MSPIIAVYLKHLVTNIPFSGQRLSMHLYNIMDLLIDISLQKESSNEFVIVKLYTVYHYLVILSIK